MDAVWREEARFGTITLLTEGNTAQTRVRHADRDTRVWQVGRVDALHLHRLAQLLNDADAETVEQMFMGPALLFVLADPVWFNREHDEDDRRSIAMRLNEPPITVNIRYTDLARLSDWWQEYRTVMHSVWPGLAVAKTLTVLRAQGVRCDLSQLQRAICDGTVSWDEALGPFRLCSAEAWQEEIESLRLDAERLSTLMTERLTPYCLEDLARSTGLVVDDELLERLAETTVVAALHAASMSLWYLGPSRGRRFGPFLAFAQASNLACRSLPGRHYCGRAIDWMYQRAPERLGLDVTDPVAFRKAVEDVMAECDGYVHGP